MQKTVLLALFLWASQAMAQLTVTWDPPGLEEPPVNSWDVWITSGTAAPALAATVETNRYQFPSTPASGVLVLVFGRNAVGYGVPAGRVWRPSLPPSPSNLVTTITVTNLVTITNVVTITNAPGPAPGPAQLIANGGFEEGTNGWTFTGNVGVFTKEISQGNYFPLEGLRAVNFNATQKPPGGSLRQAVAVSKGATYELSLAAGICSYTQAGQAMGVLLSGAANLVNATINLGPPMVAGGSYYRANTWTFTADTNQLQLVLSDLSRTTDGVDMMLDAVSIKPK